MRIALLEDEKSFADSLKTSFETAGYNCYVFPTGESLVAQLKRETMDLLVLDWGLPGMSGLDVLTWSRAHLDPSPPAIMVTARGDEADVVEALSAGAEDYVMKPVRRAELMARVAGVLRRNHRIGAGAIETFGDIAFNKTTMGVYVGGEWITLTAKEFALALLMFRNLHRPLSRSYILDHVWGVGSELASRTLDVHVSKIRRRLGLRPEQGYRLSQIYSYGYRLEVVVEDGEDGEAVA
jgi:DNA-binding response OmpR family regulator